MSDLILYPAEDGRSQVKGGFRQRRRRANAYSMG